MAIYGTGLLAACLLLGALLGKLLGQVLGVESNVGGVGFAMILLIVASHRLRLAGKLPEVTQSGVLYWSAVYVPVVVAMAASQNVVAAIRGGGVAFAAGLGAVALAFVAVPLVCRLGEDGDQDGQAFEQKAGGHE